jgi:anti-sigma factor RsiW
MLTCDRATALIHDCLDGTLGAEPAVALTAHLQQCPACQREYAALKATQALLRSAPLPDAEPARERVLARFRHTVGAMERPRRRPLWTWRPLPVGLATAATLLLFGLATLPWRPAENGSLFSETLNVEDAGLPSAADLDRMASLHAAQSAGVLPAGAELQQDALSDANSRLVGDSSSADHAAPSEEGAQP